MSGGKTTLFLTLAAFAQEPSAYYNTQQDSVAVEYAKKVERYTESAEHLSKAGTGLFIGGGAQETLRRL